MHFLYLQDDFRVNDKLTLNLGLRYEYATPHWEKDNILSNFAPDGPRMIAASDGSIEERALGCQARPQQLRSQAWLRLLADAAHSSIRGGYGVSYIHFHRAGAANILSINGPQVINAVVNQSNALDPNFRTTQQGYPEGLTDPQKFNPIAANITYMPEDYHSSTVQSYYVSVQRETA